jgi:hypothetical protein
MSPRTSWKTRTFFSEDNFLNNTKTSESQDFFGERIKNRQDEKKRLTEKFFLDMIEKADKLNPRFNSEFYLRRFYL